MNDLEAALRDLDAAACIAAVGTDGSAQEEAARQFIDAIRHTGCMVVEWENHGREKKRDALAAKCRGWLAASAEAALVAEFEEHLGAAEKVERGFRAVERSLDAHLVSARSIGEQVWGLLRWVEGGMEHVEKQIQEAIAANPSLQEITRLRITAENGESVPPDAIVTGAVSCAGNTLLMLGHRHRLFDKQSGALLLPPEPALDKAAIEDAGALMVLSSAWTQIRRGWERVRFFGGTPQCNEHDVQIREGGTRRMEVLEFPPPHRVELLDRIATARLNLRLLTNFFDFLTQTNAASKVTLPSAAAAAVPLPPGGWVSVEELNASHSLADHYCLPIEQESEVALGLPLKVWLRGYAIYARSLARDAEDEPTLRIVSRTEAELISQLAAGGLTAEQAAIFIGLTTFERGSKDLFDTPLLRSTDGRLHFFAPAYLSPNPGAVLLSRLGRLDVRFEDKGKRFERQTLKVFADAGIPARTFSYSLDGIKWDCDVAVLLDDTLFVFECKNYGLPDGHLPSLHKFLLKVSGHLGQVKRIASQLDQNRAIVRQHFGPNATWNHVIPCLLNALPWSAGKIGEVYCYDASALGKFLKDGFISINTTAQAMPNAYVTRRHKFPLWRGDKPTAADLLRELDAPAQLRLPIEEHEVAAQLLPLSGEMAVVTPEWAPRELTLEEQFRACGASAVEAQERAAEFENFPVGLAQARDQHAAENTDTRKT